MRPFQGELVRQLRDLLLQPHGSVSLPLDILLRSEILRDHEQHHQEGDGEQQRRKRIDEARPVIDTGWAAARSSILPCASSLARSPVHNIAAAGRAGGNLAERTRKPVLLFENGSQLRLIMRLVVDPFAQDFLLSAHLLHELVDTVRQPVQLSALPTAAAAQ